MRHFLKNIMPIGVTMELGQYHWYRKLFGGHWERRNFSGAFVHDGMPQGIWVYTEECWSDREIFSGDFGASIEACEDHS